MASFLERASTLSRPQASAAGALSNLLDARAARPEETTVLVLTGADLKATQRIGELMGILPEARAWSE